MTVQIAHFYGFQTALGVIWGRRYQFLDVTEKKPSNLLSFSDFAVRVSPLKLNAGEANPIFYLPLKVRMAYDALGPVLGRREKHERNCSVKEAILPRMEMREEDRMSALGEGTPARLREMVCKGL